MPDDTGEPYRDAITRALVMQHYGDVGRGGGSMAGELASGRLPPRERIPVPPSRYPPMNTGLPPPVPMPQPPPMNTGLPPPVPMPQPPPMNTGLPPPVPMPQEPRRNKWFD